MTKIEDANPELTAAIRELLPYIDDVQSAAGDSLASRPLDATKNLVQYFLVVEGGSGEEPYLQQWFAVLFAIVTSWYEAKYSAALTAKQGQLLGVVQIHNHPFRVSVSPTYACPHPSGEQSTLCFGPELGDSEIPRQWIASPPGLENLTPNESEQLNQDLRSLTKFLRAINLNFMMGFPAPDLYKELRGAAMNSIRKVADHLVNGGEGDYSSAAWEMHYSVENALKALIAQTGAKPDAKHALLHLADQAQKVGINLTIKDKMSFLPSAEQAIRYRYGQPLPGGYRAAFEMYQKLLPLLVDLSSRITRSNKFRDGATITVRRPPWFEFLE